MPRSSKQSSSQSPSTPGSPLALPSQKDTPLALSPGSKQPGEEKFALATSVLSLAVEGAKSCLQSPDPSSKIVGMKAVIDMKKTNVVIDEAWDKRARLDAGKPTEIAGTGSAIESAADSLIRSLAGLIGGPVHEAEIVGSTTDSPGLERIADHRAEDHDADPQADDDAGEVLG